MVLGECQESLEQRVIVVLMVFLVCLVIKDTEVTQVQWDHKDLLERMERGETMETLGPGVSQVNPDLVVYLALKVLLESLDLLV